MQPASVVIRQVTEDEENNINLHGRYQYSLTYSAVFQIEIYLQPTKYRQGLQSRTWFCRTRKTQLRSRIKKCTSTNSWVNVKKNLHANEDVSQVQTINLNNSRVSKYTTSAILHAFSHYIRQEGPKRWRASEQWRSFCQNGIQRWHHRHDEGQERQEGSCSEDWWQ